MLTNLPLARSGVDPDAQARTRPGHIAELANQPSTQVLFVQHGRLATKGEALAMVPAPEVTGIDWEGESVYYLGKDETSAYLAVVLPERLGEERDLDGVPIQEDAALVELVAPMTFTHLRDIGDALSARDAGLGTSAVALANWHQRNPRCPSCGEPTTVRAAGWESYCEVEGQTVFPRTDPAVIMTVVTESDHLLLGHAAHWPERRFSTLAGYVEAGESAEEAVRREVMEEAGIEVTAVEFKGSQPWPFPCSLMLGFTARVADVDQARPDGDEVTALRVFSRDELASAVQLGEIYLPMRSSIARSLIEDWYGGELIG